MSTSQQYQRMRIYLGEDKRHGDRPLYQAIVRKAHRMGLCGLTVFRGSHGFGHSTRMHTSEVLFSEDLPLVVEIIDSTEQLMALHDLLRLVEGIGLITLEPVEVLTPLRGMSGKSPVL